FFYIAQHTHLHPFPTRRSSDLFFSREFSVTPAVLIPRPETELLVEYALERLPADSTAHVLDLGTGSGCIAISIARERPFAHVVRSEEHTSELQSLAYLVCRLLL